MMSKILYGLKHTFYIYSHPFDGFWIMKTEKKGNSLSAFVILSLLIITTIIRTLSTGYLFVSVTLAGFSAWMLALGIIILVSLYCVSNWALTTLLDGNGSMENIVISLMYSLTPIVILILPITILSHALVIEEATFISIINDFSILWVLFLIIIGNSSIHEYTMVKSVLTFIGTILIMAAVAVIVILFFNLIQQVFIWIQSIIKEIIFRL